MFTLYSLASSWLEVALFLLVITIIYYISRYLWELIPLGDLKNRAIFITGCDSGFGRLIAIKCAEQGLPTFAGCYTEDGRKNLEKKTSGLPGKLYAIPLDISKDESVQNAYDFVKTHLEPGQKLWAVLNNAGTAISYGPHEWISIDTFKRLADINTYGAIRVTHAFLPLLKQSKGRVLTTGSVQGRFATIYYAPYGISKYALEVYNDVIRRELKPWGITCSIFNPGAFCTPIAMQLPNLTEVTWKATPKEIQEEYGDDFKNELLRTFRAEQDNIASNRLDYVTDAYYHAITAKYPRLRYYIGWDALFYYIPASNLPTGLQDWVIGLRHQLCNVLPAALRKEKNQ